MHWRNNQFLAGSVFFASLFVYFCINIFGLYSIYSFTKCKTALFHYNFFHFSEIISLNFKSYFCGIIEISVPKVLVRPDLDNNLVNLN